MNAFRTLPPVDNPEFDPDEDDPPLELSWPHLEVSADMLIITVIVWVWSTSLIIITFKCDTDNLLCMPLLVY